MTSEHVPLKILLVDDEKNIRTTLAVSLGDFGHAVKVASSFNTAVTLLKGESFDLILTDYRLGGPTGSDVINEVNRRQPDAVIIVMTAYSSIENAIKVTKEGAFDYLQKPFTNAQLEHSIAKARTLIALRKEVRRLRNAGGRQDFFDGYISPAMIRLKEFVLQVAPSDETVLITGETGTGKSELAKIIHDRSKRSDKPFVAVYCTTLAESVIESELFGHIKGAFTGATQDKAGKLEQADSGTLFLDEIGDLSPNAQSKLLRFLQDRVIERVGGTLSITVNARIIAATNKDLKQAVEDGKFREDLYYRLNILECNLVPLRHRKEDIPVLIHNLVREAAGKQGRSAVPTIPKTVYDKLLDFKWPGNVRELKNTIDRMLVLSQGREIELGDLPPSVLNPTPTRSQNAPDFRTLEEVERDHITNVLTAEPNQEKAAVILGTTTVTLWRKRKQYGLP